AENHGVTFKTSTAEVFSSDPEIKPKLNPETRKDSAVHVSLSSSSLVKQPGAPRQSPVKTLNPRIFRKRGSPKRGTPRHI
ncbi:hypothetical protein ACQR1W_39590, partial [Bradyrhizobium sp. HKCCYLS1011]|uniref:hypothetical protein n=1 Tax=Bradyrhizobium sp. HKCCYLS1011 TaxID=3420733 RepID=UPI003EC0A9C6